MRETGYANVRDGAQLNDDGNFVNVQMDKDHDIAFVEDTINDLHK